MTLRGTSPGTVRAALESGDPFPGTAGFAGEFDGNLVRDLLGRYPLFYDQNDPSSWAFKPGDLSTPHLLPGGTIHDGSTVKTAWELPDPTPAPDSEQLLTDLRRALDETFTATDTEGLAIAFSGGIDSALIAAALDVPLYAIGFPESHDIEAARSAAELLDRPLETVLLDHDTLETAVPAVAEAIGRTNAMDVQIALPMFLLAEHVRGDGYDRLAVGQGADELFGGYAKIARAPADHRVEATSIRGAQREVIRTLPEQLARDRLAVQAGGGEPVMPYLHDRVVRVALRQRSDHLVRGDIRKWCLRQAAEDWLPTAIVEREKKALQYGSLVARELDRLARQAGFKRRMDDHISQYIEHRCDDETANRM